MKTLQELFPRASKEFLEANKNAWPLTREKGQLAISPAKEPYWSEGRLVCKMNKTEAEYAVMLEGMKRGDEIRRYEYEGVTLRWADMKYTPDFIVFPHAYAMSSQIKLIEVKGAHIWDRDIVRFKGARAYWPEFTFEMWQKQKHGWIRKF